MNRYGLHGKLQVTAGNGPQLAQILLEASRLVSTAKGCRLYLVSQEDTSPDEVWVTEVWDSKEDHDNSLQVPGVKELISQAMPLLAGRPEKGQELTVLGGAGLSNL
ncbi:antibiotic biosynthesis monooxygenase [uncultured Pontibacter sp.]|uniref:putative quinol monooxygenase n=1 Tax=uncultured Pontibacter sp. TaxID=453356 RepID=UPI002619FADE|nr:antibiotic biosynthesis monooxygenase [uncultured Pontibacter sp.]